MTRDPSQRTIDTEKLARRTPSECGQSQRGCAYDAERDLLLGETKRIGRQIDAVAHTVSEQRDLIAQMAADLRAGGVRFEQLRDVPEKVAEHDATLKLHDARLSSVERIVYVTCGVILVSVLGALIALVIIRPGSAPLPT